MGSGVVDARGLSWVFRRADRHDWGWGAGGGLGVGRRAHEKAPGGRGRSSPRGWRRSVPVRSADDGVAREGVELSGSIRWDMGPTGKFLTKGDCIHSRAQWARTAGEGLVPQGKWIQSSLWAVGSHGELSLGRRRRRHPQAKGWAQRESAGSWRWVSPRDRAPQGAPPATTRRCQAAAVRPLTIGLGRCLKKFWWG